MFSWIMLVAAIVVAQFIGVIIALGMMLNKRFMKWYMRKVNKLVNTIVDVEFEEDED